jgi:agmatinase
MDTKNFLDIESPGAEKADALIFPFPYEGTVSYGGGTAKGPEVILEASAQEELYDVELQCVPHENIGIHTFPSIITKGSPKEVHEYMAKQVCATVKKYPNKFYLGLGGEHAVTHAFVQGLVESETLPQFDVLQIDAHTDLRDTWEDSKFSHACVMRRLRDDLHLKSVHVGIRGVGPEEIPYIKEQQVPVFYAPYTSEQIADILKHLGDNVFITFDVDGLDPSIMPATGTPVIGGLGWEDATGLLRAVFKEKNVIGMDVVELAPSDHFPFANDVAAKLVHKSLTYKFCL